MLNRLPMLFTSVAVGIIFAGAALVMIGSEAKARPITTAINMDNSADLPPNPKLQDLLDGIKARDKPDTATVKKAIETVRAMMKANQLRTASDYHAASSILVLGTTEEDALLAHDFAVCAMALGRVAARQMVAYSQDQFLTRINREQRYGTQRKNGKLLPAADEVSDTLRFILGVPSLENAKRGIATDMPGPTAYAPRTMAIAPSASVGRPIPD